MINRRQFIQTGVAGAVLLGLGRVLWGPLASTVPAAPALDHVSAAGAEALSAIANVILDGALPSEPAARQAALLEVVKGCNTVLSGLQPSAQAEFAQLMQLLENPVARRWVVGVLPAWHEAKTDQVAAFLTRWRRSSLLLLKSGYQGLHQVIIGAWYGNSSNWADIGYEGPPAFMKEFWRG